MKSIHEIKFVICDIDGTILDDQHVVDNRLKDHLQSLQDQNIPFILASARSPKGISPIARELDIMDNPIACYNGALVLSGLSNDHSTPIISHEMDKHEAALIIDEIYKTFPHVSISLYSGANWYVDHEDKWVQLEASITQETPIETDLKKLLSTNRSPIHKLLIVGEAPEVEQLLHYCKSLHLNNSVCYLSKENYLEITHREASKETALVELSRYYHVPLENTMAIGDNYNDIPMLSIAGIGIVMGNAPLEVKNNAYAVTTSNNNNGVSNALNKYVLGPFA